MRELSKHSLDVPTSPSLFSLERVQPKPELMKARGLLFLFFFFFNSPESGHSVLIR